MDMKDVLTNVQGKQITVNAVVDHLKVNGVFRNTIYRLIEIEVIHIQCRQMGVTVSEAEMDSTQEEKRRYMGLSGAKSMSDHCRRHGITFDQWKQAVNDEILRNKLKDAICTDEAVSHYFEKNSEALRMLCVGRIVCQEQKKAEKILEQIHNGEGEFSFYARKHSLEHSSRIAGGHLGCFKRGMLPPEVEKDIFAAKTGAITGPYAQNGYWAIYRVAEIIRDELNEATRSHIANKMYSEWLHRAVMTVRP